MCILICNDNFHSKLYINKYLQTYSDFCSPFTYNMLLFIILKVFLLRDGE